MLTKLRHLGLLAKSFVFKPYSALLDDIEVSWYSLKIVDDLSSVVCFDLKLADQIKHISCEKWNQFEMSLIDRVDSNEPVLASNIFLRGSSFVSFTLVGSWLTTFLVLLISEGRCCLDVRLLSMARARKRLMKIAA